MYAAVLKLKPFPANSIHALSAQYWGDAISLTFSGRVPPRCRHSTVEDVQESTFQQQRILQIVDWTAFSQLLAEALGSTSIPTLRWREREFKIVHHREDPSLHPTNLTMLRALGYRTPAPVYGGGVDRHSSLAFLNLFSAVHCRDNVGTPQSQSDESKFRRRRSNSGRSQQHAPVRKSFSYQKEIRSDVSMQVARTDFL